MNNEKHQKEVQLESARNLNACYVRPIDCGPSDILRRIGVCAPRVPAPDASESVAGFAVAFVYAAAFRPHPGCASSLIKPIERRTLQPYRHYHKSIVVKLFADTIRDPKSASHSLQKPHIRS